MAKDLAKDNPYMKMVISLMRTGNTIEHKIINTLKEFEITHIQFNILRILEAASPEKISVGDVTNGLMFPTSDVTRILDRLEKRGLISRIICPVNRRKMDISITEEGQKVIDSALPKIAQSLDNYYQDVISEEERKIVIEVLNKLKS